LVKKALPVKKKERKPTLVVVGVDCSMSSIAACASMWDGTLQKNRGPTWNIKRWKKDDPYWNRMKYAAKAHDFILDTVSQMKGAIFDLNEIFIGIEEPWGFGEISSGRHGFLKQQAQIQGAFFGGLIRWGYPNIFEVSIPAWQGMVAADFDMKRSKKDGWDKWIVKQWVKEVYADVPDWPDLIYDSKIGLKPKPKTSVAKAKQPDDRYDATAIHDWTYEYVQKYVGKYDGGKTERITGQAPDFK